MRVPRLTAAAAGLLLTGLLAGCGVVSAAASWNGAASNGATATGGAGGAAPVATAPVAPAYNVSHLLQPANKYFGVEIDGAPDSIAPARQYAAWVGKKPNIIGQYIAWGTSYDTVAAQNAWNYGSLYFMVWEPWSISVGQIASGAGDGYITQFATAVRALNIPIALSFGHEMNGNWYPWGTRQTTAAQFVAAWRHIHDLFALAGATNVIWVWNPNDIYPVPDVQLQTYYPGDAYVDWVGITGYWTPAGPHTYESLYLPTLLEIRKFTTKPFIIAETSVEAGANQESSVNDLFQAIEQHPDIVGFVWYDYNRQGDWRIENRASLLTVFKQDASNSAFGFDVK